MVPVNKELLTGTVPVNKELLTGRDPVNNLFPILMSGESNRIIVRFLPPTPCCTYWRMRS